MSTQPTADQPLVTHADLAMLRGIKSRLIPEMDHERDLLDRLIQAAEADKPALPEGWVLQRDGIGDSQVLKHKRGFLSNWGSGTDSRPIADFSGTLTPLVTAASLVPEGWYVDERDGGIRTTEGRLIASVDSRAYDVLAALVTAAQAERGESR